MFNCGLNIERLGGQHFQSWKKEIINCSEGKELKKRKEYSDLKRLPLK